MSEEIRFSAKVIPNATKNLICSEAGLIKIKIKAPAVDGKANSELIRFLAKQFNVQSRNIEILSGLRSRMKLIRIFDLNADQRAEISRFLSL